jgi:hypothetical protein
LLYIHPFTVRFPLSRVGPIECRPVILKGLNAFCHPKPERRDLVKHLGPECCMVYSTRGGTSAKTLRVTSPSRSSPRSVLVSDFWLIPSTCSMMREKRIGLPDCAITLMVQSDHLSEMRETMSRVSASSASVSVSQKSLMSSHPNLDFLLGFPNSYLQVCTGLKGALLQKETIEIILSA